VNQILGLRYQRNTGRNLTIYDDGRTAKVEGARWAAILAQGPATFPDYGFMFERRQSSLPMVQVSSVQTRNMFANSA